MTSSAAKRSTPPSWISTAGELVYRVADELANRGLPYIFATGYGAAGLTGPYRSRPVLQKPFLQSQLRQAMLDSLGDVR